MAFYYPKNMKASYQLWLWSTKDFMILGIALFVSILLGSLLHTMYTLCIPMLWAVLTIRVEDATIWNVLCYACRFFLTGQQKFYWNGSDTVRFSKNLRSTQQQLGVRCFSHYGLQTERGELLMYTIAPANISVLSNNAIDGRVQEYARLLKKIPDIEVSITDASESFDSNRAFLRGSLRTEQNPSVRRLLEQDIAFLDTIQVEMATARTFMLIVRTHSKKEAEVFRLAQEMERNIAAQGFHVHRMRKSEIKRMMALYLDAYIEGDRLPDVDGEQYESAAL